MSEEEFAKLDLQQKWIHVAATMDYIIGIEKSYNGLTQGYDIRRRLNPHHPKKDIRQEDKAVKEQQRNLRIDQYQRWSHVKTLYASHRDEMVNTLESEKYAECKNILESVFTMELDDALRDVIDD